MAINDWLEENRPREKLIKRGAAALTDAELLAIFTYRVAGKSAVDLASQLITHYKGLHGLLVATHKSFCHNKGLGDAKFAQLQAVLEMSRRYLQQTLTLSDAFTSPEVTLQFLANRLHGLSYEVFACLFLDNQHRLLHFEEVFRGSLHSATVHPREIVKIALQHNAAAIILSHNHPSGLAGSSRNDERITQQLKQALELVEVRVLDHVIIGDGCHVSFAELGLL